MKVGILIRSELAGRSGRLVVRDGKLLQLLQRLLQIAPLPSLAKLGRRRPPTVSPLPVPHLTRPSRCHRLDPSQEPSPILPEALEPGEMIEGLPDPPPAGGAELDRLGTLARMLPQEP